jgi:cell division protein FtsB
MPGARCCGDSAFGKDLRLQEPRRLIVERRRGSFTGMIATRALRRRAQLVLGPILGIALTGYFAYHLVEGDRGFKAWLRLNQEVRAASANLEALRVQRAALDLKVSNSRPDHVDPDLLDERIRATLNLVAPDDIVIMQPDGRR